MEPRGLSHTLRAPPVEQVLIPSLFNVSLREIVEPRGLAAQMLASSFGGKVTANSEETLKRGRLPQATGARRKIIEMDLARLQVRSCPRFDIIGHQLEHGPVAQRPARKEFSELERVAHNGLTSFCVCF